MDGRDDPEDGRALWPWLLAAGALIAAMLGLFALGGDEPGGAQGEAREGAPEANGAGADEQIELNWKTAPAQPSAVGESSRPTLVLLHATWCQWCRVLEHEVLPRPEIAGLLEANFELLDVDVDHSPLWLDLPDVEGLPCLVFFDEEGRHVLSKSGYRSVEDLEVMLSAVLDKLEAGRLEPYPEATKNRLTSSSITSQEAADELQRLHTRLLLEVNSNDGGFGTPARHPHPDLLLALERWRGAGGGPERVERWIAKTVRSALRGSSPRLEGEPLPDMDFGAEELERLSRLGPEAGPRWREGIERLPAADPYLGLQDPFDHGVFRYAAGPGWYHPHFERRALDNISWALLLRERGEDEQAERIAEFVEVTFGDGHLLDAVQRSNPFYYRLRPEERKEVPEPRVDRLWTLRVQARAARLWPERCEQLLRVPADRWPRARWRRSEEDSNSPKAPPDAVGELLLALANCEGRAYDERADQVSQVVLERWSDPGLIHSGRLHRLAAGLCEAAPDECGRALKALEGVELDFEHAPPLAALAEHARAEQTRPLHE